MIIPNNKISTDSGPMAKKPKIEKAQLTIFVDRRGIKVGTKVTLRNGQDIRLSMDEAKELGDLLRCCCV